MKISNMKKIITLSITIIFLFTNQAYAATTPTDSPKTSLSPTKEENQNKQQVEEKLNTQINQLKERIASRVAELNLVEKKGIIANVIESSGNQITLKDLSDKTRYMDADEITKFTSSDKNTFGLSDLTKGTKISVVGLYNKQSQRILARFVEAVITPTYLHGRISTIDKKNFTITLQSENQKSKKVDIQTVTLINAHTKEDGLTKLGFSKLIVGDNVLITGFPDKKDPSLLVANRVLVLPELPDNPKIIIDDTTEESTPSPSPKK